MMKMSTVTMGMQVVDGRDGKPWTITGKNSKAKTVLMQDAEGFERSFGLSTVNKHFTEVVVEEVEPEHIEITGEESMIDCAALQEELDADAVVEEAEEPGTEKKERKPRKKKEASEDVITLLKFIFSEWENNYGVVKMPGKENAQFRPLCVENGRQVIKVMWTAKKISFFVRVEAATANAEKWQKINYAMPFQCMFFHDTDSTRQNIKSIFTLVSDVDSVRPKKEKWFAK